MALHRFVILLNKEPEIALKDAENEIRKAGGTINGNSKEGAFSGPTPLGHVRGSYKQIHDYEYEIIITDKPFLLPVSTIESEVRRFFIH